MKPLVVHDLSAVQVFEGATNRTSVFVCQRQAKGFEYPVPYFKWSGPSRIEQDEPLAEVLKKTTRAKMQAIPVESERRASPWLTGSPRMLNGVRNVLGKSDYKGFAGSCTWMNGIYWVSVVKRLRDGEFLIENLSEVGKIKVERVTASVEGDLLYPLLRGRDVDRWKAQPSAYILLSQDVKTRTGFYSIYNVGPYTVSPWKVMWPEVGNEVRAGVCGPSAGEIRRASIPDHTIISVACETAQEAHFIAALLNSAPARAAASGYIVLHPSPHILEHIAIPRFKPDAKQHSNLASLSERCHVAASKDDSKEVKALEAEVDKASATLWGITNDELKSIQETLEEARESRSGGVEEDDDE